MYYSISTVRNVDLALRYGLALIETVRKASESKKPPRGGYNGDGAVLGRTGATLRRNGWEVACGAARVAVRATVAVRCAESACGPRTA